MDAIGKPQDRNFYLCDACELAEKLIGKTLIHENKDGASVGGIIVETEAYMGTTDAAAHSYKNKGKNGRTNIQYGTGGFAYIYMIYGLHYCFNVVANTEDKPEAVLVRAIQPVYGTEIMQERRGSGIAHKKLANGPGKLCSALSITKAHYGYDLTKPPIYITNGIINPEIETTKRIGIDYAGEAKDYMWRYVMKGSNYLSK